MEDDPPSGLVLNLQNRLCETFEALFRKVILAGVKFKNLWFVAEATG